MKFKPYSRELKMVLHLISLFIFSIPITTHVIKLALDDTFKIFQHEFSSLDSLLLIGLILLIISANIYSVITDKRHRISFLITGGFLLVVTVIQISAIASTDGMEVFGKKWPVGVSIIEITLTGILSALLLLSATLLKYDEARFANARQSSFSLEGILRTVNKIAETIRSMDRKLAFLLGIICSLLLTIPICGVLYLSATLLVNESHLNLEMMKLLAWIGIVGMQGSIISMFFGLRRFRDNNNELDSLDLFLNSLVRPFIGLSFAHLTYFMLESGLFQDNLIAKKKLAESTTGLIYSFEYHVSIAFIAGFTERIAKVIQSSNLNKNNSTTHLPPSK